MFFIMFHVVFEIWTIDMHITSYYYIPIISFKNAWIFFKFPCKVDQVDSYNHSIPLLTFIHVTTKMTSFETYMNLRIIWKKFIQKSMNFFVRYVMAPSKNDIYNQMSDYELQKLFSTCYSKDIYCEQVHK
jgi:hypothetical protein